MADKEDYSIQETLLKIDNVCVNYDGVVILKDVCAEIKNITRPGKKQGQIVGLLGPSGVGKTTLFRVLAGLMRADSGQVVIGDSVPMTKGCVGVVAQQYPLFAHRTVLGNLMVGGRQAGLSKSDSLSKSMELLKRFDMEDCANKYPIQLSGGQRQRIAIGQQFMCNEYFILMDEPFSGLDLVAVSKVSNFIKEVAESDDLNTFILVTHDVAAAIEVCDTIWLLGRDRDTDGKVIPGAHIQATYNLIERGLAWKEQVSATPAFLALLKEIHDIFPRL
ncbi:MAG: ATP-binding cassette domain-containing protein [Fimbriimonas sp.]|nr:ATP-binding cassette domain-containing protein [Fimbriimonas sp.]